VQVKIENPEEVQVKERIKILTKTIFNSKNEEERGPYRSQLQREERKLEAITWKKMRRS
jgi:hypothetical protein